VNVVSLHPQQAVTLDKRALARELGCSTRSIENRQAEGMPFIEQLDRFGRRRYRLDEVRRWLAEGERARPRDRLTQLEDRVRLLEQMIKETG
jgi:phage terminase Nu1 subunit (DNA packaging protein)